MRTTVTLDPDVAEQLKRLAQLRGRSFKAVLNDAIRNGLAAERGPTRLYRVPVHRLDVLPASDLTKALELAAALEDEETMRELESGK